MFSKEGKVFMTLPQKLEKTDLTFGNLVIMNCTPKVRQKNLTFGVFLL